MLEAAPIGERSRPPHYAYQETEHASSPHYRQPKKRGYLKHYRVPFFTKLHEALRQDGIDLASRTARKIGSNPLAAIGRATSGIGRKVPGY